MKSKILVIDDEEMIIDILKHAKCGPEVELMFCNNAKEAVELIPTADAIISDVRMANSDVLENALAKVGPEVFIVRMTGDLDHPAKHLLFKPFSLKKFKETVSLALTHINSNQDS